MKGLFQFLRLLSAIKRYIQPIHWAVSHNETNRSHTYLRFQILNNDQTFVRRDAGMHNEA